MDFRNSWADARRVEAYAKLRFPGTYYLAYRDLPRTLGEHVAGSRAVDFGCGAGRSTRFLRELGFQVVGIDISEDMIARAREADPEGDYRLVADGTVGAAEDGSVDLVLSVFTFDNIPTLEKKVQLFGGMGRMLAREGRIVNLVSAPEIYTHEWASFSTRDFPENRHARCGDKVRIVITDIEDPRPVEDVLWTDQAYREVFVKAGLDLVVTDRPLAREDEPYPWVNETRIAPWVVYILKRTQAPLSGPATSWDSEMV